MLEKEEKSEEIFFNCQLNISLILKTYTKTTQSSGSCFLNRSDFEKKGITLSVRYCSADTSLSFSGEKKVSSQCQQPFISCIFKMC